MNWGRISQPARGLRNFGIRNSAPEIKQNDTSVDPKHEAAGQVAGCMAASLPFVLHSVLLWIWMGLQMLYACTQKLDAFEFSLRSRKGSKKQVSMH